MMSRSTIRNVIVSGVLFALAAALLGGVWWQVTEKGTLLYEQITTIKESNLRTQNYRQLEATINQSQAERAALQQFFLNETTTITFLSEVEAIARAGGVQITTDALVVEPHPTEGFETLRLQATLVGAEENVLNLLEVLESLPYHSTLRSLTLQKEPTNANWKATVVITFSLYNI